MANHDATIKGSTVAFQLNEALHAIHSARSRLRDEHTEPAIWVYLADILNHLCLAWHRKRLGPDELTRESQQQYELKSISVPNWGGRFRLVRFAASHPAIDLQLSRGKIQRNTVDSYLGAAEAALHKLMREVETGRFYSCDTSLLGQEFECILHNLCLAWHLRFLSSDDISSLDGTGINELACWLPAWQWNLRLVPPDEDLKNTAGGS